MASGARLVQRGEVPELRRFANLLLGPQEAGQGGELGRVRPPRKAAPGSLA